MRAALSFATFLAILATSTIADDSKASGRSPPASADILAMNGYRLPRIFAKFGYPDNVFPSHDQHDKSTVCLEYDGYVFEARDKNVVSCFFSAPYNNPVLGCKIGDSPGDVTKTLGRPRLQSEENDGGQDMVWDFKDQDQELQVHFKDKKCSLILVRIK